MRYAVRSIYVTPEMIRAGADEISKAWLDFVSEPSTSDLWGEVLTSVFLAMMEAHRKSFGEDREIR